MTSYTPCFFGNGINMACVPGTIVAYVGSSSPIGWRLCDGTVYDPVANSLLHKALGQPVDPKLPNLNAFFLRGSGIATTSRYNGGNVRDTQLDSIKQHTHPVTETPHTHNFKLLNQDRVDFSSALAFNRLLDQPNAFTYQTQAPETNYNNTKVDASGSSVETRPFCYGINFIIKLD
jgi:microcystin-dependent protein